MQILTRKQALKQGLTHYFTGKPCKRGHVAIRRVSDGCVDCRQVWYNKEYYRQYNHRESRKEYLKQWNKANPELLKEYQKRYQRNNPGKVCFRSVNRKASKLQRTPAWADMEAIKFFYECRPAGCHVDHIIPLCGETISGLHVETNLQWLPAIDNQIKGNKFQS